LQLIAIFAVAACASAGRLENRYLAPVPAGAASSGGGSDLLAPLNTYLPPQQSLQQQQTQQDVPQVIDAKRGQYSGQPSQYSGQQSQYSGQQSQYSARQSQYSAPQAPARQVAIIRLANENPGDGNYAFR